MPFLQLLKRAGWRHRNNPEITHGAGPALPDGGEVCYSDNFPEIVPRT